MNESIWFLTGLAGSLLIWRLFKNIERNNPDFTWCPSPLAILLMAGFSVLLGPILLAAGCSVTAFVAVEEYDFSKSWLTRPICKKRAPPSTEPRP